MNVLLVDDQISILSGLISGLDWNALGVTGIRTAQNAQSAREILLAERIDILLCDIEMPGENGLSLLRWARSRRMDFVCVFLTSHADFLYAKEAIQLGCFDYILQPARYDEIQATVARAIARVRDSHEEKQLEQIGTLAKGSTASLFQGLFSDWLAGKPLSIPALRAAVQRLGSALPAGGECFIVWGHLLHWHTKPWPNHDWVYALNNILSELYEARGCGILSFSIDYTSLGWFVFAPGGRFAEAEKILLPLQEVHLTVAKYFPCDFAFYASPVVPLEKIGAQSAVLQSAKKNNILRESGVFCPAQPENELHRTKFLDVAQLRRWESLLAEGKGEAVCAEARRYLNAIAEKGELNWASLRGFWIQFHQTVLSAARALNAAPETLLPLLDTGLGAQSLEDAQNAIQSITSRFVRGEQAAENEKRIAEKTRKYIEENIGQPLSVSSVAAAFFMNPDYLSRLFKNESGVSLKEYITGRKMQSAQALLQTTELPVSVIAAKLGYDNFSHFSQAYRKAMGVSPTEERKEK